MRDGFHYKFWVYILSSRSGTLYVGITGFFSRRIHQHKYDSIEGFTRKYQCHRLVYYESYQDVQVAIAREKQIKRWRRDKKIAFVHPKLVVEAVVHAGSITRKASREHLVSAWRS